MARTVNQEEYTAKRNEILDVALRLVYTKGYERMTIQDIRGELGMSSGAFYHYFDSKPAVLEALIERIQEEGEQPLIAIVNDPQLSALQKLQHFFDSLNRSITTQKAFIADLMRVWFSDENAIVREKVFEAMAERRIPLLSEIIHQGIQEGVFTTAYPDKAAEIILSLARGLGTTVTKLMLAFGQEYDDQNIIDEIVATHAAYVDALERMLGAPTGALYRYDAEAVKILVATLRNG